MWVKWLDAAEEPPVTKLRGLDLRELDVHDLAEQWLAAEMVKGVAASRVRFRVVNNGAGGPPTLHDEASATPLLDRSCKLYAAGVASGSWLLANVVEVPGGALPPLSGTLPPGCVHRLN